MEGDGQLPPICSTSLSIDQTTQTDDDEAPLSTEFFQRCLSDEEWMIYYTNVTPEGFRSLFDAMAPELKKQQLGSSLPPEEQLFMALVKLTLDLDDKDMAYRFGLPFSDVIRYLNRWIFAFRARRRLFESFAVGRENVWKRGRAVFQLVSKNNCE